MSLSSLGTMVCNAEQYQVYFYEWEESHPPGEAIHAAYRVVFVSRGNRYIGSYRVSDHPSKVAHDAVLFDYEEKWGNVIRCDQHGWPDTILLDGEQKLFGK